MAKPPPRLHVDAPLAGGAVPLARDQAHYLGTVLRLGPGADILLFNGRDGEWRAAVGDLTRKGGHADLTERTRAQTPTDGPALLFAPLKKTSTDLVVRMGTELGAARFVPVLTARTQAERVKTDRLAVIAREAAEQSERLDVPPVDAPRPLMDALAEAGPVLFCDEAGDDPGQRWGGGAGRGAPILAALSQAPAPAPAPRAVLVGPEGGFTPEERAAIRAHPGARAASLGPRILKAETAAAAALALWQAGIGDLS